MRISSPPTPTITNFPCRTYLQNYPNYEPFLYPSLDNSTWIKSHGGYHLNLTKKNSPDTPGQFSITGTIRNEDCTLTTLGNWSAQGKTTLDSAKLTIALCVPNNPLLATAFRQNIKTIESLKKSALQFFSKGSAAIATQSAPRTSPTKHSPPCSETYYSIRPGKSSKLNGPHFRHKLFIKVRIISTLFLIHHSYLQHQLDERLSFKRKAAMKLTSFDWNPQYEGSSNGHNPSPFLLHHSLLPLPQTLSSTAGPLPKKPKLTLMSSFLPTTPAFSLLSLPMAKTTITLENSISFSKMRS